MTNVFTCLMKKKFGNGNGSGMDRDFIGNGSAKSRKLFALISANTPPYNKQSASRLLLAVLFMLAGVQGVWGESISLSFTSNPNSRMVTSGSDSENTFTDGGVTYGYIKCNYSSTYTSMMVYSSTTKNGVFYNKTAIPGTIDSISVTYKNGEWSTTNKLYVTLGTSAITERRTSDNCTQILDIVSNTTKTATTKVANASFFNLTLSPVSSTNARVATLTIYYTPPSYTVTWHVNGSTYTTGSPSVLVKTGKRV